MEAPPPRMEGTREREEAAGGGQEREKGSACSSKRIVREGVPHRRPGAAGKLGKGGGVSQAVCEAGAHP